MSILKIGMQGDFEGIKASITGKVVFADEYGSEWSQWYLESENSGDFWIREYEDEGNAYYEIISKIENDDTEEELHADDDESLADIIFADWKNIKHIAMQSSIMVKSLEGNQGDKKLVEGEHIKIADISFMDEEDIEVLGIKDSEIIIDTSIMWSKNHIWVFGIEYPEESHIVKIFSL